MQVLKVAEVLAREVDEDVPAVRGILKVTFKRSAGQNDKGDWSVEPGILTDGTNEIKLKVWNRDPLPRAWKGKEIYILAKHGERGFSGVSVGEDEYQGKKSKILVVQKAAEITVNQPATEKPPQSPPPNVPCDADGRPLEDPNIGEPERPPAQAPPAKSKPVLTPAEKWALDEKAVHDAARCIAQFANLYLLVSEAVRSYVAPAYKARHGVAMAPEQIQTCATTFYIDAQKRGLSGSLPTGALEPFLKPKGGQQ